MDAFNPAKRLSSLKHFLDRQRDIFHVDFKSHPVDISFVKKNIRDYDIAHFLLPAG